MWKNWCAVFLIVVTSAVADSSIDNPEAPGRPPAEPPGTNVFGCPTTKGHRWFKFRYPPKLDLIDRFEKLVVPRLAKTQQKPDIDRCKEVIKELREYRTRGKKLNGEKLSDEEWEVLIDNINLRCCY